MTSTDDDVVSELKEIKALLTPKPAPPPPKGFRQEFSTFLKQYGVLALAVAFILGVYLGALVQALVSDLLLPILSYVVPTSDINQLMYGPFNVGDFANKTITFIIVVFVVFVIVKIATRRPKTS